MVKRDKWQIAYEKIIEETITEIGKLTEKLSQEGKLTGLDTERDFFKPINDEAKRKIAELKEQYEKENKEQRTSG